MRISSSLCFLILLVAALVTAGCLWSTARPGAAPVDAGFGEVKGKTQPAAGRLAKIAPAVLHPVTEVVVVVGQRVKKGDPLVRIDDDEPQAELRAKKANLKELQASLARLHADPREEELREAEANLESAQVAAASAKVLFDRMEDLWRQGATAELRYLETRSGLARARADERAAHSRVERLRKRPFSHEVVELQSRVAASQAAVDAAAAELEHYTVTAPIDGIVTALDVHPGTVSRPGTSVWGEILDPRELDVRCDLPASQVPLISLSQPAAVLLENADEAWPGKVVHVGHAADPATGLVPILIRVENPQERLRCYVPVRVRFQP